MEKSTEFGFIILPASSCMNQQTQETLKQKRQRKRAVFKNLSTFNLRPKAKLRMRRILPLYSIPHLSFTMTGFPVKLFKKGFGLTGTVWNDNVIQIFKIRT